MIIKQLPIITLQTKSNTDKKKKKGKYADSKNEKMSDLVIAQSKEYIKNYY